MTDPTDFPPREHLGRELRLTHRMPRRGAIELTAPVVPEILDPDGTVQREVLATLLDEATGFVAVFSSLPDWASTAALALRVPFAPIEPAGTLRVEAEVVKAGKRLVFVESTVRWDGAPDRPVVALATGEFARVGRAGHNAAMELPEPDPDAVVSMALEGSRLPVSFRRRLGVDVLDAAGGVVAAPLVDYVRNSSGILHGGVVGALAIAAVEAASGHRVVDVTLQYLSPGRVGPFRTRAERLPTDGAGPLWRAEVLDAGTPAHGAPDAPTTMTRATATTASSPAPPQAVTR